MGVDPGRCRPQIYLLLLHEASHADIEGGHDPHLSRVTAAPEKEWPDTTRRDRVPSLCEPIVGGLEEDEIAALLLVIALPQR
jgi:hypothetical protein